MKLFVVVVSEQWACMSVQLDLYSERNIFENVSVWCVSAYVDILIEPHSYWLHTWLHMLTDIPPFSTMISKGHWMNLILDIFYLRLHFKAWHKIPIVWRIISSINHWQLGISNKLIFAQNGLLLDGFPACFLIQLLTLALLWEVLLEYVCVCLYLPKYRDLFSHVA